jgi:hypothetical protein
MPRADHGAGALELVARGADAVGEAAADGLADLGDPGSRAGEELGDQHPDHLRIVAHHPAHGLRVDGVGRQLGHFSVGSLVSHVLPFGLSKSNRLSDPVAAGPCHVPAHHDVRITTYQRIFFKCVVLPARGRISPI